MKRALAIAVLLACSTPTDPPADPSCPTLYCLADGSQILWDACRAHPQFDTCTECHHAHPMTSPEPCP